MTSPILGVVLVSVSLSIRTRFVGSITVSEPDADKALPKLVCKVLSGITLLKKPVALEITSTLIMQLPLAGMVRVAGKVTLLAVVLTAPVPVQVVLALGVPAITTVPGIVSVNAVVNEAVDGFGFVKVMVNVEICPSPTCDPLNDFCTVGTATGVTTVGSPEVELRV